jgi:methyl-accepting chemotaxis protein
MEFKEWYELNEVKFGPRFLQQIAANIQSFLNTIEEFAERIRNHTTNPQSKQQIAQSYTQLVMPAYQKLQSWIDWANQTAQIPQRESVVSEAIKISYKNFDNIVGSMKEMVSVMRKWVDNLHSVPDLKPYVDSINKAFYNNVLAKSGELTQSMVAISNKVKELMTARGKQYQEPQIGKARPYGAQQMQRQQQTGYGVPVGKPARSMLSRGL